MKQGEYYKLKKKYDVVLQSFEAYLEKQHYERNTIRIYTNYTSWFLEWLKKEQIHESAVIYNDILSFISYCRKTGNSNNLINRKLASVRKYYEYLQFKEIATINPAAGLYLKGKKRTVPNNLLDKESLETLYETYPVYDLRTQRNKIILSLLIHQAITTEELKKLESAHIKLKSGKIEIPGGKHSNARILKLESHQILEFQEYLQITRPEIIKGIKDNHLRQARKPNKIDWNRLENQLLISINGSINIKNSLLFLMKKLREINPDMRDARQIRQSVITEWLKVKKIRKVQYMAGHRCVSTTERYQVNNLEDLQEALKEHHPLK